MNTKSVGFVSRCLALVRHRLLCLAIVLGALPLSAPAQLVIYSFGTSGSPTVAPTSTAADLAASSFAGNLGSPVTGSGGVLYTAGSGGSFYTATAWNSPAPGPNYFEFTLTPSLGYGFTVESLTFAYRATSSGPLSFVIRSSIDSFTNDLAGGTFIADSAWYSTGALPLEVGPLDEATTFRVFAYGASSHLGTMRVDDVMLMGSVSAIPEPSTWAMIIGTGALSLAVWRKRMRSMLAPSRAS